ncbi:sugar ABC transporter substrate-binding protein [Sutcliffiella horikoshii]|uniref:Maltodextrin-binding protein n=1 Tax=Sutcliffiella horikoshii TaxID=79883 RepID=A0A1Y0CLI4_9BACI|nr:extracellular solute-binding protein [Sutcliffiella horikoshii]ART75767.1 ABC transporter substrate-binding protein [Sutcliffiella horikoshii]TYS61045.1 extracellular solute-binding protein [Sutcliffiella horikoshii]
MKKFLAMLMVAVLTLGVLAACGPQRDTGNNAGGNGGSAEGEGTTTEGADKPEKLTVWVNDDEKQRAALDEIFAAYTEETGIEVEATGISMLDQVEALALDGPAGNGPDVFFGPHDRLGDIVLRGLADPIDLGEDASLYSETAMNAVTVDGEAYGVPQVIETYGMFYNKDLVSAEEIATMEGLMKVAEEQTDAGSDKYGFLMEATNFYFIYPFFAGNGGYVFNNDGSGFDASDIGLANEGAVQGGELVQSWFDNGYIPKEINGDIMSGLFTEGKVATVLTGPWNIATYRDALGDKLGTATLPKLENGDVPKSFVGVKAWMLSSFSENKEWSIDLMKFITNYDNAMKYYEVAGEMPALQEALDSDEIANDELIGAFAEQTQYGEPMPNIPQMQQVWDPMGSALQFIANGDDVGEVLEEAVKTIEDNIAASGAE